LTRWIINKKHCRHEYIGPEKQNEQNGTNPSAKPEANGHFPIRHGGGIVRLTNLTARTFVTFEAH